ncbi:EamA family transporter [Ruegeria hyattellae]|uniref:EamA family transporter n=1 Tax=Ruegeria hyattellae TaxID=3233337 RepID=UPI00355B3ADF
MGGLSALSLGVADFIASQNSTRIGAARSLLGMLLVSSVVLSVFLLLQGGFSELFIPTKVRSVLLASLHGFTMAFALLLFFYAMSIGKISVVAPIVASHPLVIVIFRAAQGEHLATTQIVAVIGVLTGVALVGASGGNHSPNDRQARYHAKWQIVVCISLASSLIYGTAILFLQSAANDITISQVLWFGRVVGFTTILIYILSKRRTPFPPSSNWWPLFAFHGMLDSGGLLFLLLGTNGSPNDTLTAVVASTFPVITMGLAWLLLNERVRPIQLLGTGLVLAGVSTIVGH